MKFKTLVEGLSGPSLRTFEFVKKVFDTVSDVQYDEVGNVYVKGEGKRKEPYRAHLMNAQLAKAVATEIANEFGLPEPKMQSDINEAIFNVKAKVGNKIVTKPVSAKDEDDAKDKFIKAIEVQMKHGHVPTGEIKDIVITESNELIDRYTKKLNDVTKEWGKLGDRGQDYIDFAQGELDAVKKGGLEELKKFWKSHNMNEAQLEINEASPITIGEIPKNIMADIDKLEEIIANGGKLEIDLENIHEGIHGYIIGVEFKSMHFSTPRLDKEQLTNLGKVKTLRWIELEEGYVTLGMGV